MPHSLSQRVNIYPYFLINYNNPMPPIPWCAPEYIVWKFMVSRILVVWIEYNPSYIPSFYTDEAIDLKFCKCVRHCMRFLWLSKHIMTSLISDDVTLRYFLFLVMWRHFDSYSVPSRHCKGWRLVCELWFNQCSIVFHH